MRAFKNRIFQRWAEKEGLDDVRLRMAVAEIERGLIDAELGGHVIKKRVAINGKGKRSGYRTLIAYRSGDKAFFVYGFAKNELANVSADELKALRLLAKELLGYSDGSLAVALRQGILFEVDGDE